MESCWSRSHNSVICVAETQVEAVLSGTDALGFCNSIALILNSIAKHKDASQKRGTSGYQSFGRSA